MSKKFYSRKEAAEVLGVSKQSVSYYASTGLLTEIRRGKYIKFLREEVDNLNTIPAFHTIEELRAKAEEVAAKEAEILLESAKRLDERSAEFKRLFCNGHPEKWQKYRDLIMRVVKLAAGECLTEREEAIMWSVLDLDTLQDVADYFHLTRERVRQVFEKALRHLLRFRDVATTRFEAAVNTIERLQKENAELKATIWAYEHPEPGRPAIEVVDELEKFRFQRPFTIPVADLCLSVRAWHCLRDNNIKTVGDLVGYTKCDLMKFRNFGRKSLNEIEELLDKMGLRFGMWRDPDRKH